MLNMNVKVDTIDHMNTLERGLKRVGDVVGAVIGLIVLAPLFIVIIIIQKCDGTSTVFFSQERIGRGGQPFRLLKFRTMRDEKEDQPMLSEPDDERLTGHGKFLRRHHLDELPQLWNVLKGDMSLVGYRPERQYFINQILAVRPDYELLYCSRPGITSEAAIRNGYTYTLELMLRRLDMDLDYLRHRTLATDLRILLQTVVLGV